MAIETRGDEAEHRCDDGRHGQQEGAGIVVPEAQADEAQRQEPADGDSISAPVDHRRHRSPQGPARQGSPLTSAVSQDGRMEPGAAGRSAARHR